MKKLRGHTTLKRKWLTVHSNVEKAYRIYKIANKALLSHKYLALISKALAVHIIINYFIFIENYFY